MYVLRSSAYVCLALTCYNMFCCALTCYNMSFFAQVSKADRMKDVYSCREEKELHDLFLKHNVPQKVCNDIFKIVTDVSAV